MDKLSECMYFCCFSPTRTYHKRFRWCHSRHRCNESRRIRLFSAQWTSHNNHWHCFDMLLLVLGLQGKWIHSGQCYYTLLRKCLKKLFLSIGTTAQLHAVTSAVSPVAVAGVQIPVADEMKVLGVVLDRRLTFENHVTIVARSCHCHVQAIRHIRHVLLTELASTLERSLILTRLDYCNALLHDSQTSSIQTLRAEQRR